MSITYYIDPFTQVLHKRKQMPAHADFLELGSRMDAVEHITTESGTSRRTAGLGHLIQMNDDPSQNFSASCIDTQVAYLESMKRKTLSNALVPIQIGPRDIDNETSEDKYDPDGHLYIRECSHTFEDTPRSGYHLFTLSGQWPQVRFSIGWFSQTAPPEAIKTGPPSYELLDAPPDELYRNICNQLDFNQFLNKEEGKSPAMLYSFIIQLGLPIGRLSKSVTGLKHQLTSMVSSLRKLNLRQSLRDILYAASSTDLAYRFAILTTLTDIVDLCATFDDAIKPFFEAKKLQDEGYHLFVATAESRRDWSVSRQDTNVYINTNYQPQMRDWQIANMSVKIPVKKVIECYDVRRSKLFLRAKAGFDGTDAVCTPLKTWLRQSGITRPLESLWDLVPMSFVLDYFLHIDTFVSTFSNRMSDLPELRGSIIEIDKAYWDCRVARVTSWKYELIRGTKPALDHAQWAPPIEQWSCWGYNLFATPALIESGSYQRLNLSAEDVQTKLKQASDMESRDSLYPGLTHVWELSTIRKRTLVELAVTGNYRKRRKQDLQRNKALRSVAKLARNQRKDIFKTLRRLSRLTRR